METIISRETAERALAEACRRAHAEIVQFMVAPRRLSIAEPWDGDEWLIEFAEPPRAPELFPRALDEALCRLSAGYRARRATEGSMAPPRVIELPAGTFERWRTHCARLGKAAELPRVASGRLLADALLAVAALAERHGFAGARSAGGLGGRQRRPPMSFKFYPPVILL